MSEINNVLISGTVWGDPTVGEFKENRVCRVNLDHLVQVSEDKKSHNFFECEGWNQIAIAMSELSANDKITVNGKLKFVSWEDKKDGSKRSKVVISVVNFQKNGYEDKDDIPF